MYKKYNEQTISIMHILIYHHHIQLPEEKKTTLPATTTLTKATMTTASTLTANFTSTTIPATVTTFVGKK